MWKISFLKTTIHHNFPGFEWWIFHWKESSWNFTTVKFPSLNSPVNPQIIFPSSFFLFHKNKFVLFFFPPVDSNLFIDKTSRNFMHCTKKREQKGRRDANVAFNYLNENRLRLFRRQIQDFLLRLAEFRRSFVVLFFLLLYAADRVFAKSFQGNDNLVVGSVELKQAKFKTRNLQKFLPQIHHIVTFIFYGGNELAELLQAVGYHLLIVGLRRANALEVEFI